MAAARATLDFFGAERAARRRTALLLAAFLAALAAVVGLVFLAALFPASLLRPPPHPGALFAGVAAAVVGVTGAGSAYHSLALARAGGDGLARMMGGALVDRRTAQPDERRLLNVVEEMAIASGVPVPRVYLLAEERGINAFAAGHEPGRAVIAVTRGALDELSRDEIQGVVAHEFSHLLNADARLNLRLMGVVGGLTFLSLVGRWMLDEACRGGRRADWRVRGLLLGSGLALAAAGWVGVLCGQLVRFAVSRQREYLADASAVQFTRNPGGLAGALRRIARQGSRLTSPRAVEASHFFFANGLSGAWASLFSTHPPLEERLRRVDAAGASREPAPAQPAGPAAPRPAAGVALLAPEDLVARMGGPQPGDLDRAREALRALPTALVAASRDPRGAGALACSLLLAGDPELRRAQLAGLAARDAALEAEVRRLGPALEGLARERRLALLNLALPSLDALSAEEAASLREELRWLAEADGRLTLFEWAVQRAVARRLERRSVRGAPVRYRAPGQMAVELLELLSVAAWAGARDEAAAETALGAGMRVLGIRERWRPIPRQRLGLSAVDRALGALDLAAPELKRRVLAACAACAAADARLTAAEAELLGALAASLGCPLPPPFAAGAPAEAPLTGAAH